MGEMYTKPMVVTSHERARQLRQNGHQGPIAVELPPPTMAHAHVLDVLAASSVPISLQIRHAIQDIHRKAAARLKGALTDGRWRSA